VEHEVTERGQQVYPEAAMTLRDRQSGLILLIEDDRQIAEMVGVFLERRGYSVDYAADGMSGLNLITSNSYDAIVLDLRLPGMDGLEVCRKLRREVRKAYPVLMLTAHGTLEDKLAGLNAGADDYMVKPFEIRELDARLYALIRRDRHQVSNEKMTVGNMTYDPETLRVNRGGMELPLTPIGIKLLAILMRESPRVVSRQDIEREIWGDALPDSDTLRSHIHNLRKVMDRPFHWPLLHTMPSAGYRMVDLNNEKAIDKTVVTSISISPFDHVRLRADGDMHAAKIGRHQIPEQMESENISAER
jgi:DNA-binding response OmpR family regulator